VIGICEDYGIGRTIVLEDTFFTNGGESLGEPSSMRESATG
jgi:hypothetical protein